MKLLKVLILLSTVVVIAGNGPCYIESGGYESFIRNVPEDTPVGSVLGKLNVTGSPSEVNLEQQQNLYLWLDPMSRNITLNKTLDTDGGQATIFMEIKCKQIGVTNSPEIPLMVRVILEDVNDNRPIFKKQHYYFNVSEDTLIGTSIYRGAMATDADQRGGGNDQISYRILPGQYSEYFDIEYPLYPDIKLKKSLDYEALKSLTIGIEAKDIPVRGDSLSSTAMITFYVDDVDDLNPSFHSPLYMATVNINATVGTVVKVTPTINATDQDALNAPIVYKLNDPDGAFVIDGPSGVVYVNTLLSSPFYAGVLRAIQTDNPTRYGAALLKINVQMQSNISTGPAFPKQKYETNISESQPRNAIFLTVAATPGSSGRPLQYSIMNNVQEFDVDQWGNLMLRTELDYEEKRVYQFTLAASDGINLVSTQIKVRVLDINDNNPVLRNKEISVTTERIKGSVLTSIQATDKDSENFISYRLVNFRNLFAISPTGDLNITGEPRDLSLDTYYLAIEVYDSGDPPRKTISVVTVKFPFLYRPVPQTEMPADGSEALAVVFGVIAAVFLVIIILLVVYIIRRHISTAEELSKVKHNRAMDPKGLTYKSGDPSPEPGRLGFDGYMEAEIDGATSVQDNPLSQNRYAFNNPNSGTGEIILDTAVIPYGKSFNNYEERREYQNGMLKTFHVPEGSSSGESSDSTGDSSNRVLMKGTSSKSKKLSWGSTERINQFDSEESLQTLPKKKGKPEITVYF